MAEPTLYERLGGIFAIAAVVDHFSDQLLKNPKVVEANPELNEWHTTKYPGRLPGLTKANVSKWTVQAVI
jgi:hemoglobin